MDYTIPAEVRGLQRRQLGLITRPQAVRAGMHPDVVDRLLRTGVWVKVRRGVYADVDDVPERWTDRRIQIDLAASLRVSAPHVMSHDSAAHLLGMPVLRPRAPLTHLTRPRLVGRHVRLHDGIKHHLAPFADEQVVEVAGRRVLGLARTAVDVAREHGHLAGVVAADSARRLGATLEQLCAALEPQMRNWPNVTVARAAVDASVPDSDSIGETLARDLVTELGLGVPQTQFGLTAGGRTVWCDLRLDRHVVEFDGRVKYQRVDEGGFASSDPSEVLFFEKQRQDFVCGFKLGMSRLVWADLFGDRRRATLERLRREYLDTCQRFGTDVDDLEQFRPRGPRPRPPLPGRPAALAS